MGKIKSLSELRKNYSRAGTEYLDTGIPSLNDLLSGGLGLPTGKMIEFHSDNGFGKTTIVLQILKHIIDTTGVKVLYLDVENALDESLRDSIGISQYEADDPEYPSFLVMEPYDYEEVGKTVQAALDTDYDIIVYDSIANTSLVVDDKNDDEVVKKKIGSHSLQQGELLKYCKGRLARRGKTMIIINQMRANIQTNPMAKGPALAPAGGKALDHNCDVRVGITSRGFIVDESSKDKKKLGRYVGLSTIKNKVHIPFKRIDEEMYFGHGISVEVSLMNSLIEKGIVQQSGGWFIVEGQEKKIQGKDRLRDYVEDNYDELIQKLGNSGYTKNVDMGNVEIT